jgi:hypothetical protein
MTRIAVLAILGLLACNSAPAFAQNSDPRSNSELLGAPGYQAAQEEAERRAAVRKQVEAEIAKTRAETKRKADQAAAAKQAAARKAEQARLAKQADELKVREAKVRAKEQELAAEQERLAQMRAEIEDEREYAEAADEPREAPPADPRTESSPLDGPLPEAPEPDERPGPMRLDASIQSCEFAGENKALARDYLSARYVRPPRFFERNAYDGGWELRGVMRVEDRRGYLLADTVCELGRNGRVQDFAFLRSG